MPYRSAVKKLIIDKDVINSRTKGRDVTRKIMYQKLSKIWNTFSEFKNFEKYQNDYNTTYVTAEDRELFKNYTRNSTPWLMAMAQ